MYQVLNTKKLAKLVKKLVADLAAQFRGFIVGAIVTTVIAGIAGLGSTALELLTLDNRVKAVEIQQTGALEDIRSELGVLKQEQDKQSQKLDTLILKLIK